MSSKAFQRIPYVHNDEINKRNALMINNNDDGSDKPTTYAKWPLLGNHSTAVRLLVEVPRLRSDHLAIHLGNNHTLNDEKLLLFLQARLSLTVMFQPWKQVTPGNFHIIFSLRDIIPPHGLFPMPSCRNALFWFPWDRKTKFLSGKQPFVPIY